MMYAYILLFYRIFEIFCLFPSRIYLDFLVANFSFLFLYFLLFSHRNKINVCKKLVSGAPNFEGD